MSTHISFSQQNFKVYGVKFFNGLLNIVKLENERKELPSSALATYILLHFECNDIGLLPREFQIMDLAKKSGIPYTTIYTGFQVCLERKLVRETPVGNRTVYEIVDYALYNHTAAETTDMINISLSYFRIPFYLIQTTILSSLVKARDNRGIMFLLELINTFSRKIGMEHYKHKIEDFEITRKMAFLKEKLNRNAKKVRQYIEIVKPIIKFNAVDPKDKKPSESRITRVRRQVQQVIIEKFNVIFSSNCVIENDKKELHRPIAKCRKEAVSRLKHMGQALRKKDKENIMTAFRQEIVDIAIYLPTKQKQNELLIYAMTYALDQVESCTKDQEIFSIPAFMRVQFREAWTHFAEKSLSEEESIETRTNYHRKQGVYPDFM
ncbi:MULTISPECIES: hypothetical protein [Bacillus cereus group]|uniref:hypothetical protein n=1 Tax=Bacillus cereus group TaxID=86661 RepID=UPI000A3750B7|nr:MULTISPECIES: hypothetical protein [Bacillus cereus group]MCR6790022.1 hypothetical protein [Bacillus thuringiensis]MCR6826002.1 hypothetical protein [Bacillus thuringiensis]MCR6831854.1 hypothetical protein [Bacillus thuringiensis]MEB9327264.1 hypothetical protein [Bacillus cereus]MEB9912831.1 hypothetical protein [Bacillus cereus]